MSLNYQGGQLQTIEYTYREDEKAKWGDGPWNDECDKRQWLDEQSGLPCLIVRGPMGQWCGYVGVPSSHPLFEVGYNQIHSGGFLDLLEVWATGELAPRPYSLEVHGGLTFADFCAPEGKEHGICHVVEPGEDDRVWWLGFDCGHTGDVHPGIREFFSGDVYRTQDYVTQETVSLAHQLAACS